MKYVASVSLQAGPAANTGWDGALFHGAAAHIAFNMCDPLRGAPDIRTEALHGL